jgi:DNA polymerase III subunit delta
MIVALAGENSFGLQQELDKLVSEFIKKHGDLALERLDGEEVELEKIREAVTSLPFLADKKMVILRAPSTNKQFAEQAEQILAEVPETNDVIVVEPKPDKRTAYYKYLKKETDFREFPEMDQHGLARWLVDSAKQRGGSLNPVDARYLVERVGPEQQLLSNELEKLLLYDSKIDRRTIDLLTEPAPQSTIFQLLEAAFAGRTKIVLKLYAEQRAQKVEPAQIIAMLAWQLHVLAIVKTAGDRPADAIAREAKLNPFVVRKSQGIARDLTLAELKKLTSDLLKIDVAMKRTAIDADEALQHYLLRLAKLS